MPTTYPLWRLCLLAGALCFMAGILARRYHSNAYQAYRRRSDELWEADKDEELVAETTAFFENRYLDLAEHVMAFGEIIGTLLLAIGVGLLVLGG